ncbi:MAG: antibiotic biosynthesis monooxygenase family protein [Desulfobacterales bacterium]|jgi:heme oxygenase (mycobilin-producing)
MAIKILIKRHLAVDKIRELLPLVKKLRTLATNQTGYISGETLRSIEDPGEYLVISTWLSLEEWRNWFDNPERLAVQKQIDALTDRAAEYKLYDYA